MYGIDEGSLSDSRNGQYKNIETFPSRVPFELWSMVPLGGTPSGS
jgi:hypothetical protein